MNKAVGEAIGALIGDVIGLAGDEEGEAVGGCVRVRILVNVTKPLLRWTSINFGNALYRVLFRYKKLADFCYVCGQLDHKEKHYVLFHPDGLRYYGSRLRANGTNLISLNKVITELNQLNTIKSPPGLKASSPLTPTSKGLLLTGADNEPLPTKSRRVRDISPIHIYGLFIDPDTPLLWV